MTAYLVALLIVGSAAILGAAVCRACDAGSGIAPAAGLAFAMALAVLFVRLPGGATVAAIVCALAIAAAAIWLVRHGGFGLDWAAVAASGVAGLLTTLPFLSAGRVELPGMSLNNDTAVHMLWAEGLRSDLMRDLYPSNPGYPLGPHGLLATIAQGTGLDMDTALTGLLIAMPMLFALVAAHILRGVPALLRIPAAGFVGMTYLAAAWFGQGAFKEPMLALLVLGFAVGVGELLARDRRPRALAVVPVGLVAAASLLTYSYLAIAWLGLAAGLCIFLTAIARRARPRGLATAVGWAVVPTLIGAVAALVAVAPELPRLWSYLRAIGASPTGGIAQEDIGNLAGPLPLSEALGIWPTGDFRFPPPVDSFMLSELKLLVLVAAVVGAAWLLWRRRDAGLVSALGAAAIVVFLSNRGQSPYVTAKALVVLSPFVMLVALRALLPERLPRVPGRSLALAGARIAVAAVLVAAGLWSSQLVLRGSPVASAEQRDQLAELRERVADGPTLFLGVDDYAGWRLRGMPVGYSGVGFPAPVTAATRAEKPYEYGSPIDWDSFDPETLDRFRYVIAPRGAYQSQPPPNFRRIASTELFEAWRRTGPTAPRETLDPPTAPLAVLDCAGDPKARRLSRRPGVAAVAAPPIPVSGGLPPLGAGAAVSFPVTLPRGEWRLAASYTSITPVRLQIGSRAVHELPPNTGRPGVWWPAGTLRSDGAKRTMTVVAERESRLSRNAFPASVSGIVAVRPGARRIVPLRRACGRLVDWYRVG
jgi:hypothetical protein